MPDDWLAENLNFQSVELQLIKRINNSIQNQLSNFKFLSNELAKGYEVTSCLIVDDYDNFYVELNHNTIMLDILYKTIIHTTMNGKSLHADTHMQYLIHDNKIIDSKLLFIQIESNF